MPRKSWFAIKNAADTETAEIFIYDQIGSWGVTPADFIAALNSITASAITLRINSPGGEVFAGYAIFNALARKNATITAHIDGVAASMASVIAMAGDTVEMAENAMLMIHNPCVCAAGESEELRKAAELLDKIKLTIVNTYAKKTGLDADEIAQMMDAETWLSAEEAKEKGFCDVVSGANDAANSIAAKFDFSRFAKSPLTARAENMSKPTTEQPATTDDKNFLKKLTDLFSNAATLDEVRAQLAQRDQSILALTGERDAARNDLATTKNSLADALKERDGFKTQLENATAQVDAVKAKLKDQASNLALDILASLGVTPVNKEEEKSGEGEAAPATLKDAVAAYNKEADPAKKSALWKAVKDFWAKNK